MSRLTKIHRSKLHRNGLYWYGIVPSSLENYEYLQLIMVGSGSITIPTKSTKLREYIAVANRKEKHGKVVFFQIYLKTSKDGSIVLYKNNDYQWSIGEYKVLV